MHRVARMKDALIVLQRKVHARLPSWTEESQKPPIETWLEDIYNGILL